MSFCDWHEFSEDVEADAECSLGRGSDTKKSKKEQKHIRKKSKREQKHKRRRSSAAAEGVVMPEVFPVIQLRSVF